MNTDLKYYIQEIRGMLTKECEKNFVVLFSHVVNFKKIDAIPCLQELEISVDKYFYFENDCLCPLELFTFPDDDDGEEKKEFLIT
jgi:hypothetical protein